MFFSLSTPPLASGGEELDDLAAHVHGLLHLACGSGAGHHDAALVDDVLADLGVKAGGNDEGSTGSHSAVSLILGQDSAGAQQHIGAAPHGSS